MVKFQYILTLNEPVYAEIAADNAMKLAEMYNAEISIINVVDNNLFKEEEIGIQTELGQALVDEYKQICENYGISINNATVAIGSPVSEIIKMQEEIDASLIILGASKTKLGKIAEKLVKDVKCHVLIARKNTFGEELFSNILVPVDSTKDAEYAGKFASSIAHRSHSNLTACHIFPHKIKEDEWNEITKLVLDIAKSKGIQADSLTGEGKTADEILNIIYDKSFNLVVLGYSGRGKVSRFVHGSVSEKVIHSATCSVFVVKSIRPERVYTVKQ
ncbi:MAG: Nucleotide-binding universal stress protein [Candidatus Methanocomedens sp.]|nr:MAG: Nucleotide-binding universal stress protein [ANME-2 cluster archaeon]